MSWLRAYNIFVENIKEEDIIFGKFSVAEDFVGKTDKLSDHFKKWEELPFFPISDVMINFHFNAMQPAHHRKTSKMAGFG